MPIGSIISAGASLLGGLFGSKENDKAREAQMAMNERNIELQREFAKNGIQWKAADAKAAGIHPIYALGGSTSSFTPVSANFSADTAMPNAIAAAGQDIGRAVNATRTASGRVDAFSKTAQALQLENMSLQNDNLRSEIASKSARLAQTQNPPMPSVADRFLIPGQSATSLPESASILKKDLFKQTPGDPWKTSQEPGANPDTGHLRTSGGLFPVPSQKAKEAIEDNWYQETMHFIRNNLLPMITPLANEPPHPPSKGKAWVYDPVYGYKQVPDNRINKFLRNHVRD